jgi:serine/threonine-protein kinase HipA
MRKALIRLMGVPAGILIEHEMNRRYTFEYLDEYNGRPVSLTMPLAARSYAFSEFPPFFDGLLPEGIMLEGLLRQRKIARNDCFSQLIAVGLDMPGAVTAEEMGDENMPHNR